jgi:hypothetical protein
VIADLIGKGKHIRTVPLPAWAKRVVDDWTTAAGINSGIIFRLVGRMNKIQFLLGHASVQTRKYLGCKQKLSEAVNDKLGLEDI